MTIETHELDIKDRLNRELYNQMVILRNELLEKIDKLEKKLDIAVKALKEVVVAADNYRFCQSVGYKNLAEEALKQIEEVK